MVDLVVIFSNVHRCNGEMIMYKDILYLPGSIKVFEVVCPLYKGRQQEINSLHYF